MDESYKSQADNMKMPRFVLDSLQFQVQTMEDEPMDLFHMNYLLRSKNLRPVIFRLCFSPLRSFHYGSEKWGGIGSFARLFARLFAGSALLVFLAPSAAPARSFALVRAGERERMQE